MFGVTGLSLRFLCKFLFVSVLLISVFRWSLVGVLFDAGSGLLLPREFHRSLVNFSPTLFSVSLSTRPIKEDP